MVNDVRPLASVTTAARGSITLGVAVGPRQCVADQLLAKADVIRAMHEREQLCQDPRTEFPRVLASAELTTFSECMVIILQEKEAAKIFEVGQRSLERLFPEFTENGLEQATLSASQSGVWLKIAQDPAQHCSERLLPSRGFWT